ncbi:MAG: Ldh family oxidoreductase [Burkholderiales bacterium]|nr:Ldh family oxidoreductase [Anaerolineae bacterium]
MTNSTERYLASDLLAFATTLLQRAGLSTDRAGTAAEILLEADLMGHTTHGFNLLGPYLGELESGAMTKDGEPTVVADHSAALTWDGRYLPGPWLVTQAMDVAFERIRTNPVVTIVIQRSHHIACLAAYPKRATDKGLFMLLTCSDPRAKSVAPFGGIRPLYTPNPLAVGIPMQGDPIIIDISMSTTTNGLVGRLYNEGKGEHLPHEWLLDNQGNASDDPATNYTDPPGTVLPLGGMDSGHKGFALGILVEALTSALGGYGRADAPTTWGASVFLQIIDPDAFGGRDRFMRETEWFAEAARSNPTAPGNPPVRLPGSRALQQRANYLESGIVLYPSIMPALAKWADKLGVEVPKPL